MALSSPSATPSASVSGLLGSSPISTSCASAMLSASWSASVATAVSAATGSALSTGAAVSADAGGSATAAGAVSRPCAGTTETPVVSPETLTTGGSSVDLEIGGSFVDLEVGGGASVPPAMPFEAGSDGVVIPFRVTVPGAAEASPDPRDETPPLVALRFSVVPSGGGATASPVASAASLSPEAGSAATGAVVSAGALVS